MLAKIFASFETICCFSLQLLKVKMSPNCKFVSLRNEEEEEEEEKFIILFLIMTLDFNLHAIFPLIAFLLLIPNAI